MARQIIDIGAEPGGLNDGDPARTAFSKVNDMTGELYAGALRGPAFSPSTHLSSRCVPGFMVTGSVAVSVGAHNLTYGFISPDRDCALTGLSCEVTVAGTGAVFKLLAYRCSSEGVPGALVAESAEFDGSVIGMKTAVGFDVPIAAGEVLALTTWGGAECTMRFVTGSGWYQPFTPTGYSVVQLRVTGVVYGETAPNPAPVVNIASTAGNQYSPYRLNVIPHITF
jgi:hypothetical protein